MVRADLALACCLQPRVWGTAVAGGAPGYRLLNGPAVAVAVAVAVVAAAPAAALESGCCPAAAAI